MPRVLVIYEKHECAPNSIIPSHFFRTYYKMGDLFYSVPLNFHHGTQVHHYGYRLFHKMGQIMTTFSNYSKMISLFMFNNIMAWFIFPTHIVMDHGSHFQKTIMIELSNHSRVQIGLFITFLHISQWTSIGSK